MAVIDLDTGQVVGHADAGTRQAFIKKTYIHLAGAIALFAVFESILIMMNLHIQAIMLLSKIGSFGWLGVLLVYGVASNIMHKKALTSISLQSQYMAWGAGILIEALILLPMLGLALLKSGDISLIQQAGIITIALVAGLTAVAFTSGKDFSFLGKALTIGGFIALGVIVLASIFGFTLGTFFVVAMVVFASAAILYETSQIQHHYHESQYVGASLSLFASVGLLFWYVLQLVMAFSGDD